MTLKLGLILLLLAATACQQSAKNDSASALSNEQYQAQIKAEKKKQSELDLPYRGFSSEKSLQTIAFSAGVPQAQSPAWTVIEKTKPQLMIMSWSSDSALNTLPEYRSLREKVPVMASCNDCDSEKFVKNWPYIKTIIPDNQDGTYHSKVFGTKKNQTQVIVLNKIQNPISQKQLSWLENELKKSVALKILTFFSSERENVLSLLKKTNTKNVILITNDQPISSIEKNQIKDLGVVYEATSNSINPGYPLVSNSVTDINFGLIKIDWSNHTAQVEIRSINDQKIQSAHFKF